MEPSERELRRIRRETLKRRVPEDDDTPREKLRPAVQQRIPPKDDVPESEPGAKRKRCPRGQFKDYELRNNKFIKVCRAKVSADGTRQTRKTKRIYRNYCPVQQFVRTKGQYLLSQNGNCRRCINGFRKTFDDQKRPICVKK